MVLRGMVIVRDGTAEWNRTTDPQIHNLVL